jgi:hypothetical protein
VKPVPVLRQQQIPFGNDRQRSKNKSKGKSRSFAAFRMASKGNNNKSNSRFPSGMTDRKAKGNSRFPSGMTDRLNSEKKLPSGAKALLIMRHLRHG